MKHTKILLAGLTALALAGLTARAQTIGGIADLSSVNDGDIVLGVRNAASANDLVIDLGQFSEFHGLTPGTTYTLSDVKAADFTSTFGATVFSTTGTTWTVFGGNGASALSGIPTNTLWGASVVSGASYPNINRTNNQGATSLALDGFTNSLFGGTSLTGNGAQNIPVGPGSFTALIGATANFGYFPNNIETSTVGTTKLELFELKPGTGVGTDLGTFTLSSSGLTFTAFAAIPEPSTYAMILGVATLGFAALRRRKQNLLLN